MSGFAVELVCDVQQAILYENRVELLFSFDNKLYSASILRESFMTDQEFVAYQQAIIDSGVKMEIGNVEDPS